jgi:hypothetical protein
MVWYSFWVFFNLMILLLFSFFRTACFCGSSIGFPSDEEGGDEDKGNVLRMIVWDFSSSGNVLYVH